MSPAPTVHAHTTPQGEDGARPPVVRRRRRTAPVRALVLGVVVIIQAMSTAGQANAAGQMDCGIVTCTARFDRADTEAAQDVDKLTGMASTFCGGLTAAGVAPGIACAVLVNGAGVGVSLFAKDVHADGDCLGLKFVPPVVVPLPGVIPSPPAIIPIRVESGTFNCR